MKCNTASSRRENRIDGYILDMSREIIVIYIHASDASF